MSRSKHTDPRAIRAARRVRAPREGRAAGDLSRRRDLGRLRKELGGQPGQQHESNGREPLRIIVQRSRPGFHHPAGKRDILELLAAVGPVGVYGLRSIELTRSAAHCATPVFGRYFVPGRIVLFEQPLPPWRWSGLPTRSVIRRLEGAGAAVTRLMDAGGTLVEWPEDTLRRFMLEHVLLHELGHHVLQHHRGKRLVRIVRTRDHEAFAARFAEKQRMALAKGGAC